MKFTYCADVHLNDFAFIHFDKKATKLLLYNTICICFHVQWSFNDHVLYQPRPQGFSLKKWVGRPTHFLREEPWGRGWFFTLSIERLFLVLCRLSQEWNLSFSLVSTFLRCQALVSPSPSTPSLLWSPDGQQLYYAAFSAFYADFWWRPVSGWFFRCSSCGSFFSFLSSFSCVCFPVPLRISLSIPVHFARRDT